MKILFAVFSLVGILTAPVVFAELDESSDEYPTSEWESDSITVESNAPDRDKVYGDVPSQDYSSLSDLEEAQLPVQEE